MTQPHRYSVAIELTSYGSLRDITSIIAEALGDELEVSMFTVERLGGET